MSKHNFDRRFVGLSLFKNHLSSMSAVPFAGFMALATVLGVSSPAQAQSVWGGAGSTTATTDYNLGTNWSNPPAGAPPVNAGQSASFDATGSATVAVTAGPITPNSWTFMATSQSYFTNGQNVNFNGAGPNLVNNANAGQTIQIANIMTGAGISQAGASTMILFGTNSFTTTNVTAGTLDIENGLTSAVTNSATFNNNGNLTGSVTNSGTFTTGALTGTLSQSAGSTENSGTITGTVSLTGGTFTNTNTGRVQGTTTNNGGTVTNDLDGFFANVTNTSGTFNNNSFGSIAALNNNGGAFVNASSATVSGLATVTSGTVSNAGSFTGGLTNSATFTQTAGSTSGGTINTGIINANGGAFNGAIANNAGGTFNIGGTVTSDNTFTNSDATSRLLLNSGSYAVSGLITNSGDNVAGGIAVAAGATLNASGGFTNNSGAIIVNNGTFNSAGTSVNNGTITGNTTITAGMFSGTGASGNVQVNAGATLTPGNGAAGSSMTFAGLALQSGAIYMIHVNPTTSSFAGVTGTATLGGATVNVTFAGGSYIQKQYTIMTAGNVSGTFNPTTVNTGLPSGFHTTLSYDGTDAYLNLALNFAPSSGQLNGNQQAVANTIVSFFNTSGGINSAFSGLSPAGLTQVSGETATGSQQTTFNAMGQFMAVMTDPFMNRGGGVGDSSTSSGYAEEDGPASAYAASKKTDAFAMFTQAPPQTFEQHWSVWAAGYGGSQTTSGNSIVGSNNTTSSVAGTAVGADYLFSPNTIAGFAIAGGGTSFSVANGGSGRSDLFQAGAYVRHNEGPAYISAALAYGWQDITTNRTVTAAGFDQLRAEFNANGFSGRLEGGYRFVSPATSGIGITPYAAAQFVTFDLPSYAESVLSGGGAFALTYGAKDVTDARTELGFRTDKSFAMPDGLLTLRSRFAWAHEYDPNRSIVATFQSLPGASFVVNGAAQASDSALTTASIEMKWRNGWSVATTFEGEFSDVTTSYAGKGVVRYTW